MAWKWRFKDDYELAEGLRKKVETWDHQDSETIELVDPETRRRMENDPMFKVEKTLRRELLDDPLGLKGALRRPPQGAQRQGAPGGPAGPATGAGGRLRLELRAPTVAPREEEGGAAEGGGVAWL